MSEEKSKVIYICPNCFTPADQLGACSECGTEVIEFCPGGEEDLCRRPVVNSQGKLCTHVPLWWIRSVAPALADRLEANMKLQREEQ